MILVVLLSVAESPLFFLFSAQSGFLFDENEVAGHLFSCSGIIFPITVLGSDNDRECHILYFSAEGLSFV